MAKNSILRQLLVPVAAIFVLLTAFIVGGVIGVFRSSYTAEISTQNLHTARYIAEAVGTFLDGAYSISEEIVANNDIISMDGSRQGPVLASVAERNPYLETLYIQGLDGVQTGRSSGTLGNRKDRWWFRRLLEDPSPFISQSYYSIATNMPCASVFLPIERDGEVVGNIGVDLRLDYLQSLIASYRDGRSGRYSFIIDGEGVVVAHPDSRYIEELYNYKAMTHTVSVKDGNGGVQRDEQGNILTREEGFEEDAAFVDGIRSLLAGESGTGLARIGGERVFIAYAPVPLKGESDSWGVVTVQERRAAFHLMRHIVFFMLLIGCLSLAVAIVILVLIARSITTPIRRVIPALQSLADGNFGMRLDVPRANNEMDDIVSSFNSVSERLRVAMDNIKAAQEREHKLGAKLFEETQNLAVATKETAATSQDSSAAVKEIVATMEDSNSLSENISVKISDVSKVAQKTSDDVAAGVASIERNMEQLHAIFDANRQTIEGMKILGEKIESIWDIVTLINTIADQAKIIAFNTELEVASAGEAGEPFRIVANEIRRLSDGIIDGTKEIKEKITEIQKSSDSLILASESGTEKINAGYENAKDLGAKFASIRSSSEVTAASAEDITEIIQQQAIASEQILIALKQIAGGVENFTVATDNISRSAENLRGISEELNRQMSGTGRA